VVKKKKFPTPAGTRKHDHPAHSPALYVGKNVVRMTSCVNGG